MYLLSRWYTRKVNIMFLESQVATHATHSGARRAVSLVLLWSFNLECIWKRERAVVTVEYDASWQSFLVNCGWNPRQNAGRTRTCGMEMVRQNPYLR